MVTDTIETCPICGSTSHAYCSKTPTPHYYGPKKLEEKLLKAIFGQKRNGK